MNIETAAFQGCLNQNEQQMTVYALLASQTHK